MSQIVYRPDQFAIGRPYFVPEERVASAIHRMKEPAYTWRTWLRRLYVLTWPLSLATRSAAFIALGIIWLVLGFAGFIAARLAYVWHGERSPWD